MSRDRTPALDESGAAPEDGAGSVLLGWIGPCWAALPEWVLTTSGVLFLLIPLALGLTDYRDWASLGPFYRFDDGRVLHMPFVRLLSDWTAVLVLLGFALRMRPLRRNTRPGDVALGLLGSTWLYAPYVISAALPLVDRFAGTRLDPRFHGYWMAGSLSFARTFGGTALVTVGNLLDTWGYTVLLRSFSQTPEARELRTTGPYRLMRHPVYFGQMLAQAGVYLCFAARHATWVVFWAAFCAIQLRRAWREEQVLEAAFGSDYLGWKKRTFWFW
jgi:protein-S-isoprenylcysteine O-methyltransferase Ste14